MTDAWLRVQVTLGAEVFESMLDGERPASSLAMARLAMAALDDAGVRWTGYGRSPDAARLMAALGEHVARLLEGE